MAFPLIPLLTAIPSLFSAYKTVKTINDDKDHNKIKTHQRNNDQKMMLTHEINALDKGRLNALKKEVVVDLLAAAVLSKLEKRGGNKDDLRALVDFVCVLYKLANWKG